MATSADIKFSSITIDDLTPKEAFIGTTSVNLAILSYLYFNDSSKYSQIMGNLICYLVNIDEYGERADTISIGGIETRVSESGEGTFSLEISIKDTYSLTFNKIGTYYILLTTTVDDNVIEILSTEGINIKSKLSISADINVTRNDDELRLDVSVISNSSISSYPSVPMVQIQFFTENKQYNTVSIIEDGISLNYISENMISENYTYSKSDILLTKIGKLNNLFVRLIVSLDISDKLIFDKKIPVDVIYDVYDNETNKGFAVGKYCDEEQTLFECDFPAKFNNSVTGIGIINYIYPVGTYYHTDNEGFNPNIEWIGTKWELLHDGRFLLSSSPDYPVTIDGTSNIGGEAVHKLSIAEMPAHGHGNPTKTLTGDIWNFAGQESAVGPDGTGICSAIKKDSSGNPYPKGGVSWNSKEPDGIRINATHVHSNAGGSNPHNNMPPYRVVNIWHRIA